MSDYLRQAACYNKVAVYDFSVIKEMNRQINAIGVNINQLVTRVNSTDNVYEEDVNYIKEMNRTNLSTISRKFFIRTAIMKF